MRTDAAFVLVPYDSARRDWRMGRGPAELARRMRERRHHEVDYNMEAVEIAATNAPGELDASFSLYQDLALKVRAIRESRKLPVVLSGNCAATLGTVAGAGEPGVVWFDAHGDFNTPQTSSTGFLDGMSLAALTGACWSEHTATIPGFVPVAAS
ncbi:MAG TPA: arginase family protein, partial [Gemmatimonadaceae bacterium]|nr:arginase family protein [Gemmatimonadaceae bacterium]